MRPSKLEALDSVRGVAALVVVFHHAACAFAPDLIFSPYLPWLRVLFQGDFAVRLFFVLSGFVLSLSYFRSRQVGVLRSAAVRRYFRLAVPVALSVALSYALFAGGLYYNDAAAAAGGMPPAAWLRKWYQFTPSVMSALQEASWRALFDHQMKATYNSVLWTMTVEFRGSLFVFALVALTGGLRNRGLIYFLLSAVLLMLRDPFLVEFVAGTALADWYVARASGAAADGSRAGGAISALLVVAGVTVGGFMPPGDHPAASLATMIHELGLMAGAIMVVAGVLLSGAVQRALECRPLLLLGKASFPLYLVHAPVLCSLSCYLYVELLGRFGLSVALAGLLASAVGIVVSLGLSWVGAVTVEPLSIWVGRRVEAILFHPPAAAPNHLSHAA